MKMGEGIYRNLHRGLRVEETGDARGKGLFATELIAAGTLLWKEQAADVRRFRFSELDKLDPEQRETLLHYAWQTGDDVLEGPISADEAHADASFAWNHSCDPSAWLVTDDEIVARKDISPGDEITCDYATWIASPVLFEAQFPSRCLCGSDLCREYLSANDWRRPELQKRYGPHFLSFVLRRIVAERSGHDAS